ncbi:MAG TPA: hypothetical protein VG165_06590 [Solirubrobacteraceae bacterium]|nr:hypothetical protein [Solirubrobacteraceae bacterium]
MIAALLSFIAALASALPAAGAAPDPATNLQMGSLPLACYAGPVSAACEAPLVGQLDAARETFGLVAYALPGDFPALAPDRQLFILVNLDRLAYSLPVISGLSPQLDAAAQAGAVSNTDPAAPSSDRAVWASSWAGGLVNVLAAYYQWMYADGFPGLNIDCPDPGATGCWVHRHGILFAFGPSVRLTMGAATATDRAGRPAVGLLIAATAKSTGLPEDYTWADAEADGAGRGPLAAPRAGAHRRRLAAPQITSASVSSAARTATVFFTGATPRHFECALIGPSGTPAHGRAYASCRSPATYSGLRPGAYDFFVRASGPPARRSASAHARFAIN